MKFKSTIYAILLFAIAAFPNAAPVYSQSFSISNIDASNFPMITAGFVALDATGKSYEDLSPADFSVFEEGLSMNATVNVDCYDVIQNPEISVLLVIDQSGSMEFKDTVYWERRFDWVLEGATEFINSIVMEGRTKIAITTFGQRAFVKCRFTNVKQELLDSLDEILIGGATQYDPPFLSEAPDWKKPGAVARLKEQPADMRRIVVFLTDGDPNDPPETEKIIDSLNAYNIQVYSITLTMPMNKDLQDISEETGGDSFAVFTKEALADIYKYIALDIQTKQFCDLTWIAPYGCTEKSRFRDVELTFIRKSIRLKRPYTAPEHSVAVVESSEKIVSCGNPPTITSSPSRTVSFTPLMTSLYVDNIRIQPVDFFSIVDFGGQLPYVIDSGMTKEIVVQFTQGPTKDFRQAELIFEGGPCPPHVTLIGGYSKVKIIQPNGGEISSICDAVDIIWGGVDPGVPVDLEYSTDNGDSWAPIVSGVTGLIYKWTPAEPSNNYRIRASVSTQSLYLWAAGAGSDEYSGGMSLTVANDDLHLYVAGYFEDRISFGSDNLASSGGSDIFLAKYDVQGNPVYAKKAGGRNGMDSAMGVCMDPEGNIYVTGVCYKGARFGTMTPSMEFEGLPYCFVARYPPDGNFPKVKLLGAEGVYTTFKARGVKIRYDEATEEVYVQGNYLGQYERQGSSLPRTDNIPEKFTIVYDKDLSLKSFYRGGTDYPDYSKNFDFDSDNNKYETGTFSDKITFGKYTVKAVGKSDVFINKWGTIPGSEDLCDDKFAIQNPLPVFTQSSPLDLGECTLGDNCPVGFTGLLRNNGEIEIEIVKTEILDANGNPSADFTIQNIVSMKIAPGAAINIELGLSPQSTGLREGTLTVYDVCAGPISIDLIGQGICTAEVVASVDMGSVTAGMSRDSVVTCIFKNTNTSTIRIKPVTMGADNADFRITYTDDFVVETLFVEKDSCKTFKVWFEPKAAGPKTAYIYYDMPEGCENPTTDLFGIGVETNYPVTGKDWGVRRALSINDSVVIVDNQTSLSVNVDSIQYQTPPGAEFSGDLSFRGEIPTNSRLEIPVTFTPQAEGAYQNGVLIYLDALQDPLRAEIKGVGLLPQINIEWECDTPVKPNESSSAYLILSATSQSSELQVNSVGFETTTNDFSFTAGPPPTDFIIDPQTDYPIEITFHPQTPGRKSVNIIVLSDAYAEPDTKPRRDTIEAVCDALGANVDTPVDFGAILLCDSDVIDVEITNRGGNTPVQITGYYFSGADSIAYEVVLPGNFEIAPGQSETFQIVFTPTKQKSYNATLHLINSIGQDLYAVLSGEGHIIHLYTSEKTIFKEPGLFHRIPVFAEITGLANSPLEQITMLIEYNTKMLYYRENFSSALPSSWKWDAPVEKYKGTLEVSGVGELETPFHGRLFSIDFQMFLSDQISSKLFFKPILGDCLTPDTLASVFTTINVCNLSGRLVRFSEEDFSLNIPAPNPADEKTILGFSTGLDCHVRIDIVNYMGAIVRTLIDRNLKAGAYDLTVRLDELSSGVYNVRMVSGSFSESRTLMISK